MPKRDEPSLEIEDVRAVVGKIKVSEQSSNLHPIAANILKQDTDRRDKNANNYFVAQKPYDGAALLEDSLRLYRVMDALLRAVEAVGGKCSGPDGDLISVRIEGHKLALRVRWRQTRQSLRTPPEALRRLALGLPISENPLQSTGRLFVSIERMGAKPLVWEEIGKKKIENHFPDVVVMLIAAAREVPELVHRADEAERRQEVLRREQAKREQKREREQWEAESLRRGNIRRWEKFQEMSAQFAEVEKERAFLRALKAHADDTEVLIGDKSLAEWLAWAEQEIETRDPIAIGGPEGVFLRLR